MLNIIWVGMVCVAVLVALFTGKVHDIILAAVESAKFAFNFAMGLTAVMCLWMGTLKIAEESGMVMMLQRALRPLLSRLFPDVPAEHPAMGAMMMNLSANFFGLNNAATPFGLKAMEELEKMNPVRGVATDTMCTFVALHSSNMQLIPTGAIAILAVAGSLHPTDIVIPFILSSVCTLVTAVLASKIFARIDHSRGRGSREIIE